MSTNQVHARRSSRGTLDLLNRSDKLIAAPGERLQERRYFRIVPERLSQIENVSLHDLGLDVGVRPHGFEQLLLSHHPVRMIQEVGKNGICLRLKYDAFFGAILTRPP